jgi:hypothetical protein
MSEFKPAVLSLPTERVGERLYWRNAEGGLTPHENMRAMDQLKDERIRKVMGHGIALSQQVSRFLSHTFRDIGDLEDLIAQEYGVRLGGKKGNITLVTFDGLYKIEVRVARLIEFGPELRAAKALIDECLNEWAADSRAELRALVTQAFRTDGEGKISRSGIFGLLRLESDEPRWNEAMRAIREAIIVIGSKTYVRLWQRAHCDAGWSSVTINLAKA